VNLVQASIRIFSSVIGWHCSLRYHSFPLCLPHKMLSSSGVVHSMTRLVLQAIESGENPQVLVDLHRICGEEEGSIWVPKSPQEIANRIFCVRTAELIPSVSSHSKTAANIFLISIDCVHGYGEEQFLGNSRSRCRSCMKISPSCRLRIVELFRAVFRARFLLRYQIKAHTNLKKKAEVIGANHLDFE
jgi:hypothetical protein